MITYEVNVSTAPRLVSNKSNLNGRLSFFQVSNQILSSQVILVSCQNSRREDLIVIVTMGLGGHRDRWRSACRLHLFTPDKTSSLTSLVKIFWVSNEKYPHFQHRLANANNVLQTKKFIIRLRNVNPPSWKVQSLHLTPNT